MGVLEEPKPVGSWRIRWANAGNIKFPRPQFEKMLEVKEGLDCKEWRDLANVLHDMLPFWPEIKELVERRRAVYKV